MTLFLPTHPKVFGLDFSFLMHQTQNRNPACDDTRVTFAWDLQVYKPV